MKTFSPPSKKWIIGALTVLLTLLAGCGGLYVFILRENPSREHFLGSSRPFTPEKIEGWMTFEYLNVIFKIPPSYFREKFEIQDARYPSITLRHYAKQSGISLQQLIKNIQKAIREYQPQ